jgi:hypothetical protein
MDRQSRPACTSVEGSCKNGSAAKPFTDTLPLPYENDIYAKQVKHLPLLTSKLETNAEGVKIDRIIKKDSKASMVEVSDKPAMAQ